MFTSGRTVASPARKPTTIASATRDARRIVNRLYPAPPWNVGLTVESRGTANPRTLAAQVRTTVTFPAGQPGKEQLALDLYSLPGVVAVESTDVAVTITRTV